MLTRWDPFGDLFRRREFWDAAEPRGYGEAFTPAVDVVEEKDALLLKAEIPGVRAEEVDVSVHGNVLTLKGERKISNDEKREGYRRIERSYGSFTRSFTLPDTIELDKVGAELRDGILTVRLPKRPQLQPRRIDVKGAEASVKGAEASQLKVGADAKEKTSEVHKHS